MQYVIHDDISHAGFGVSRGNPSRPKVTTDFIERQPSQPLKVCSPRGPYKHGSSTITVAELESGSRLSKIRCRWWLSAPRAHHIYSLPPRPLTAMRNTLHSIAAWLLASYLFLAANAQGLAPTTTNSTGPLSQFKSVGHLLDSLVDYADMHFRDLTFMRPPSISHSL